MIIQIPTQATSTSASDTYNEITLRFPSHCTDGFREVLMLSLQLYLMGSWGCSRGIKIEDWNPLDNPKYHIRNSFGFDGDGADRISEILVNGKPVDPFIELKK